MNKETAIIIINWNSYDCTRDCIQSLQGMTFNNYDIILVDNDSKDKSGERLNAEYPYITYLKLSENRGFTGGNNYGMNYSINRNYTYTLLLNNDTFVEPDFLEVLVGYMKEHPAVGAIQPKIYFNHDRTLLWNGGSWFNPWIGNDYVEGTNRKFSKTSEILKEPDWLTGCAFLVRNAVISSVGLLDESLFMYYEDVDYSFRIKNEGYSLIYHPQSVVYHIAGASTRAKEKGKEGFLDPKVHYYLIRNKIWLLKKYIKPLHWISAVVINALYLTGVLAYFLLNRRFLKFKTALSAIKDGIKEKMTSKYRFDESV